jgi:hypothetical protein
MSYFEKVLTLLPGSLEVLITLGKLNLEEGNKMSKREETRGKGHTHFLQRVVNFK